MTNELLLILSVVSIYSFTLLFYKFFGTVGLCCWNCIATIIANIEVLVLVDAFGMEQTLGNILFASTFLATDILSEVHGKKFATKAVILSIISSICFVIISQSWFLYSPNSNDWVSPSLRTVFSNTPRLIFASVFVYAIIQIIDIWIYHFIWKKTTEKFGNSKKFLWLRNNGSTLTSQLINTVLFTILAFGGTFETKTIISIIISNYIIYVVTSLLDTPVIYLARKFKHAEN